MKTTTTKLLIVSLMFITAFMYPNTGRKSRQIESDSAYCLEISGRVMVKGLHLDNTYKAELILGNQVVDSIIVRDNKKFSFILKKDTYYAIRIVKDGYVTRLVSICTKIEEMEYAEVLHRFHFDTELIAHKETAKLDKDALDFPIALISFDNEAGWFDYSEKYTSQIKRMIYSGSNDKKALKSKG